MPKKESGKKTKQPFLGPTLDRISSSIFCVAAAGIISIVLGMAAIYSLHPYLSLVVLIALAAFFFELSEHARANLQKAAAASFAVALFILILAVPSGGLGMAKCPDHTAIGQVPVRLKYFTSPFCIDCILFDKNVEEAQKIAGNFTVDYYDTRYCKRQADYFGFPGPPCYVFFSANATMVKRCGAMSPQEIAQVVQSLDYGK